MREQWRTLLSLILVSSLCGTPRAHGAFAVSGSLIPVIHVTPEVAFKANISLATPEAAMVRLTRGVPQAQRASHLESRARAILSGSAGLAEDILQVKATIILLGVLSFQASREHRELLQLAKETPKADAMSHQPACTAGTSAFSSLLCSGEFYLGTIGGAAFLASNALVTKILELLIKPLGKRAAFLSYLSAVASTSFMMFGSSASSFLWTEAVKALPSAELIGQASGLAGRALMAHGTGRWQDFKGSEDGRLFDAVLANIYNILVVDEKLRDQWIYNTWRYGIARGEFITSIGVLMAVESAKNGVGAAIAGTSWTAPVIGYIICGALGGLALSLLFDINASQALTKVIQNARSFVTTSQMRRSRPTLQILARSGFVKTRYPEATGEDYIGVFQRLINEQIGFQQKARESYANIALEKFYELLLETRKLETKIKISEKVIRDEDMSKHIYVSADGEILTYAKAMENACIKNGKCQITVADQLKVLDEYRPLIKSAKETLSQIASALISQYDTDVRLVESLRLEPEIVVPFAIAMRLYEFQLQAQTLRDNFAIVLAGSDANLARGSGLTFSPEQMAHFQSTLSEYYTQSFHEKDVYDRIKVAVGM